MHYFLLGCSFIFLSACSSHGESYYRLHPQALREAIQHCPDAAPKGVTCSDLSKIAQSLNTLARQLQESPQGFGHQIILLQEKLANQEASLKNNPSQTELPRQIEQSKQLIAEYGAVVRWLESPEK